MKRRNFFQQSVIAVTSAGFFAGLISNAGAYGYTSSNDTCIMTNAPYGSNSGVNQGAGGALRAPSPVIRHHIRAAQGFYNHQL